PVTIHCGDYRYDYSHPRRLKRVLHEFPNLVVDAAHFGGWSVFDYALEFLEDESCFLDMSSSMRFLGPRRTRELVEAYGTDRILFGSDFPMWNPGEELERFRALGFSEKDYEKMCWHNAERFLGMQVGE
ncbi:MAG: amidohydrolase family protein, partial [Olsenella sp.]